RPTAARGTTSTSATRRSRSRPSMSERLRRAGVLLAAFAGLTPVAHAQAGAAPAGTLDRVAAIVNEDVIALSELYDFAGDVIEQECLPPAVEICRREVLGDALDTLVRRALQRQELERLKSDATEDEI